MFDLVCGMELERETGYRTVADGAPRFFCTEQCLNDFLRDEKKYLTQEPAILLERVHKTFSLGTVEVPVLRGLSMRVYAGDLVGLVGPSGSGKSTAMNIIGTLDAPTGGKASIAGRDIATMSDDELAELRSRKIGFVFQQFNLIPSLTALENVMLPRTLRGRAGEDAERRARELLSSVGLGQRVGHKPMELSGGEQQRVAIARAFMNDPDIILADEPTGNLDSLTAGKTIDLLVDFWRRFKKTIIIVTHDPHVASHMQRILSFQDGRLVSNHDMAEKMLWKEKPHHGDGQGNR